MKCNCCPFECNVDRVCQVGVCKAPNKFKIARIMPHYWEEPCISGTRGSGTIFFSHCNASCLFCQNYKISQQDKGRVYQDEEFISACKQLIENSDVHNINLVSPTSYSYRLLEVLPLLKQDINIPIVWNSNSYEKVLVIEKLENVVDVFLPDLKYFNNNLGLKFSQLPDYFLYASAAIKMMHKIVGEPTFDDKGIMRKGMIIRHMILPGQVKDSKEIFSWIAEHLGTKVYISLMSQYYPIHKATKVLVLNRYLTWEEYEEVENYCLELGFENGYFQDLGSNAVKYTPEF